MFTVRGRFDGKTIELLEPPPVDEETFVLVTFLEGPLETAAARESRRAVSVAMFSLDRYAGPLKQRLRAGQRRYAASFHRRRDHDAQSDQRCA